MLVPVRCQYVHQVTDGRRRKLNGLSTTLLHKMEGFHDAQHLVVARLLSRTAIRHPTRERMVAFVYRGIPLNHPV